MQNTLGKEQRRYEMIMCPDKYAVSSLLSHIDHRLDIHVVNFDGDLLSVIPKKNGCDCD